MEEEISTRPGGKTKAPLIVKIRVDEQTLLGILATKPNSIVMSTFCAMLVELGLERWKKQVEILKQIEEEEN